MGKFFDNALATLNSFNKNFSDIDKMFDDFDADAAWGSLIRQKNELLKKGHDWFDNFGDFIKEVKDTVSDWEVQIPYNRETDDVQYTTDNGQLTVKVQSHDHTKSNTITATIPENAIINRLTKKYDDKNHVLYLIVPKKKDFRAIQNDKIQKLLSTYNEKKAALKNEFEKQIDEVRNEKEPVNDAPTTETVRSANTEKRGKFTAKVKNGKAHVQHNSKG